MGGVPTVYVGPLSAPSAAAATPGWHPLGPVAQAELAVLMRSARLIIVNGGSTLLQAIACGSACIAVPIAKDQFERTRRCVAAGVAVSAAPESAALVQAANRLLRDDTQRAALARRAANRALADGLEVALESLARLIQPATPGRRPTAGR